MTADAALLTVEHDDGVRQNEGKDEQAQPDYNLEEPRAMVPGVTGVRLPAHVEEQQRHGGEEGGGGEGHAEDALLLEPLGGGNSDEMKRVHGCRERETEEQGTRAHSSIHEKRPLVQFSRRSEATVQRETSQQLEISKANGDGLQQMRKIKRLTARDRILT